MYHSIGGLVAIARTKTREIRALHLRKLNDAQKLTGKAVALDNFKQWVMAVSSGKVEHVDWLVKVNLQERVGFKTFWICMIAQLGRCIIQEITPRRMTCAGFCYGDLAAQELQESLTVLCTFHLSVHFVVA